MVSPITHALSRVLTVHAPRSESRFIRDQPFVDHAAKAYSDEGFSMRATARGFGAGLTLARVDKPLKEEAVGC